MDINQTLLEGTLAAAPELREFGSGAQLVRLLVTVRSSEPRKRVDVLPVTLWDPPPELVDAKPKRGDRVHVTASLQRRFWEAADGRKSRIEVVAHHVIHDPAAQPEPGS